jgi:predicted DNA-binding transcriptional regulator AlpA
MREYQHILRPSVDYLEDCGYLLLDIEAMATFLQIPRSALQYLVHTERIPQPVQLGFGKSLRWSVLDLLDWVQAGCPRATAWIEMRGKPCAGRS